MSCSLSSKWKKNHGAQFLDWKGNFQSARRGFFKCVWWEMLGIGPSMMVQCLASCSQKQRLLAFSSVNFKSLDGWSVYQAGAGAHHTWHWTGDHIFTGPAHWQLFIFRGYLLDFYWMVRTERMPEHPEGTEENRNKDHRVPDWKPEPSSCEAMLTSM